MKNSGDSQQKLRYRFFINNQFRHSLRSKFHAAA